MLQWVLFVLTVLAIGLLMIRKPLWLVPLLAIAVALEISSTWYPDLGRVGDLLGIVSLTRLTSVALILAAFFRLFYIKELRQKFRAILKDPLTLILLIYIILGAASMLYSADLSKTLAETIRLLVLFAVFLSIALLMDKNKALLPFHAVHLTALALAPLSFYEAFTGNAIWHEEVLVRGTIRVNATFVDPNIFARFLVLAIVANFILQLYTREKSVRILYMGSLAILLAQLALTSSRGGILTLLVILVAALFMLPNKKAVLWVFALGALCAALVLFIRPDIWDRLFSLSAGLAAAAGPVRAYLWQAALAIFADHPVLGTGLGTFQTVFLNDYAHLKTVASDVSLSHTTVLTIAAELGTVGLLVLVALWVILIIRVFQLLNISGYSLSIFTNYRNHYYAGAGYFLWVLTVFVSSQGEGRFFEDPIFWLGCALLVVLKLRRY